jgi:hypothetical protein
MVAVALGFPGAVLLYLGLKLSALLWSDKRWIEAVILPDLFLRDC